MSDLLTETIRVPASRATLQARLNERLRDRQARKDRNPNYPSTLSDGWLDGEIQALEAAIARSESSGEFAGLPAATDQDKAP